MFDPEVFFFMWGMQEDSWKELLAMDINGGDSQDK
jgi:hypothetical protein